MSFSKILLSELSRLIGLQFPAFDESFPHDPIRMDTNNTEDLDGQQASLEIVEPAKGSYAARKATGRLCDWQ